MLLIYTFISTNIKLKQKDIGILTALGTKTKDLAKIFITESFLILLIPCIIQTILTIITMNKLNEYIVNEYELNVVIFYGNILSLILTIIISILIIFLSSYYPIKKLTDMKPINVIKEL
ncbi:MAG: FtsX-like permease family protein [Bacilli bacterium]|nr:FtsX-like permease family protein [Bacilli bacterium]